MLRYSEASGSSDVQARSFGVPQDDSLLRVRFQVSGFRITFHSSRRQIVRSAQDDIARCSVVIGILTSFCLGAGFDVGWASGGFFKGDRDKLLAEISAFRIP